MSSRSIRATHRAWRNRAAESVAELEREGAGPDGVAENQGKMLTTLMPFISGVAAKKMFQEGDLDLGILCVGQGIGQMREVLPAAEIVRQTVAQAAAVRDTLGRTA